MKTKKIIILIIALIAAVGAVLAFIPTILTPPEDIQEENVHLKSVKNDIDAIRTNDSFSYNDSIFLVVTDKLYIYSKEGFLNSTEVNDNLFRLIEKYIPELRRYCYGRLRASVWRDSDHELMLSRIKYIKSIELNPPASLTLGDYVSGLEEIESIIADYRDAWKAAGYSSFYSVEDANRKISEAEKYRSAMYISNCTSLMEALSAVRMNIGRSHYNQVDSQVEKMSGYASMTSAQFTTLQQDVSNAINEYEDNKANYGPSAKSADILYDKANDYRKSAMAYFGRNATKSLAVWDYPDWMSMESPNRYYDAYRSTNVNEGDSEACLTIRVEGMDSFTFFVRSDGEADYDYIIVGLDRKPTVTSYFATTKGAPSGNSSFSAYKKVTVKNLGYEQHYIYVVYQKDQSVNSGSDRGYVLVPKI